MTTDLPIVPTSQNGPGTQWSTVQVFDPAGNATWSMDADDNISLDQYDAVTGDLLESVANVNTASGSLPSTVTDAADTVAVPTLSGSPLFATLSTDTTNLNAISDYLYDLLGRPTLSLGPAFVDSTGDIVRTATFTTYQDSPVTLPTGEGENGSGTYVATMSGYYNVTTGDWVLVNPLAIEVSNLDGQDTDDLQGQDGDGLTVTESTAAAALTELASAAASLAADSSPTGLSRWVHYDYAAMADATATLANSTTGYAMGDLMDMKVYSDIATGTYNETYYGYSAIGNENVVVDPTGTITYMIYDARGLEMSRVGGTADAGVTDADPTGGRDGAPTSSSSNNMLETESFVYDGGNHGGDGNVTQTTVYVNASDTRVTLDGYDWRDRELWVMVYDGAHYTFTYQRVRQFGRCGGRDAVLRHRRRDAE